MKVLVDTNVILDVFTNRAPHEAQSAAFLALCDTKITGCLCASQTTDVFYLLRRAGSKASTAHGIVKQLAQYLTVLDLTAVDVNHALTSEMTDYEDALLACRAARDKVDYIVTRNEKDFNLSPVPAISPQDFLARHFRA